MSERKVARRSLASSVRVDANRIVLLFVLTVLMHRNIFLSCLAKLGGSMLSEKEIVRRSVAITLGIICVVVVAGLVGARGDKSRR